MIETDGRHRAWMRNGLLGIAVLMFIGAAAVAQSTRPANSAENLPLRRSAVTQPAFTGVPGASHQKDLLDLPRLIMSLAIVLGLIFFLRWIGKRLFPSLGGAKSSGAVRLLSRSPLTPRQQVLLVQVGRRVLVVADNGTQMNRLADITDPEEVASLIGQVNRPAVTTEDFDRDLNQAQQSFETTTTSDESSSVAAEPEESDNAATTGELEGLMQKVRVLARHFGRSS